MNNQSGIYKIESLINPKRFYIGSAINLKARKAQHISGLRHNRHHSKKLQRHYNKYGVDDLSFSTIEYCDIDKLIEKEQIHIDFNNPCFNACKIAGSTLGRRHTPESIAKIKKAFAEKTYTKEDLLKFCNFAGKTHTEETKQKMSNAHKNKAVSDKTKKKLSDAAKGNTRRLGAKLSDETKLKISKSNKGKQAWNKGKKLSNATKEKIKLSWIIRKQKAGDLLKVVH